MSRRFIGSATNVLTAAVAPITAVPLSMSAWATSGNANGQGILLSLSQGSGGGTADNFQLLSFGSIGTNTAAFATVVAGASSVATAASVTAGPSRWHHYGGASSAITSRFAYFDGLASAEQTTSRTPTAIDSTSIGALKGTGGAFTVPLGESVLLSSLICEVGLWNVALTRAEFMALAKGARVSSIRPGALVGYWLPWDELSNGNAFNYAGKSGPLLALTGVAPNVRNIPPVFRRGLNSGRFDFQVTSVPDTQEWFGQKPVFRTIGRDVQIGY